MSAHPTGESFLPPSLPHGARLQPPKVDLAELAKLQQIEVMLPSSRLLFPTGVNRYLLKVRVLFLKAANYTNSIKSHPNPVQICVNVLTWWPSVKIEFLRGPKTSRRVSIGWDTPFTDQNRVVLTGALLVPCSKIRPPSKLQGSRVDWHSLTMPKQNQPSESSTEEIWANQSTPQVNPFWPWGWKIRRAASSHSPEAAFFALSRAWPQIAPLLGSVLSYAATKKASTMTIGSILTKPKALSILKKQR